MQYDAIVILGGGVNYDGSINDISRYKVDLAAELFNSGFANTMIMSTKWSGFLPKKPALTEAESMRRYATSIGVPESAISKEEESMDTIGNAVFVKQLYLVPNNWTKIVVITSDFHMPRTRYIFEKVMGPKYEINFRKSKSNFAPEVLQRRLNVEQKLLELTKKFMGGVKDGDDQTIKELLFSKHPFYSDSEEAKKLRENLVKEFSGMIEETYEFG